MATKKQTPHSKHSVHHKQGAFRKAGPGTHFIAKKVFEAASNRLAEETTRDTGYTAPSSPGEFHTSVSGQLAGCQHYLPANRLEWWSAQPPNTGPITPADYPVDPRRLFDCVFHPALRRKLTWNALGDFSDIYTGAPNALPGIEFVVINRAPRNVAAVVTRRVQYLDDAGNEQTGDQNLLLVTSAVASRRPGPPVPDFSPRQPRLNDYRSLLLAFPVPQHAVGLDYGYLSDMDGAIRVIHAAGVQLIAYDHDGRVLTYNTVTETGADRQNRLLGTGQLLWDHHLVPGSVKQQIGVRDRDGRIAFVELRFTRYQAQNPQAPGEVVAEMPVVHRVWHEPLPPAVTVQGVVGEPHEVHLPFRCNRALALLRGFDLSFDEGEPREIESVSATLEAAPRYNSRGVAGLSLRPVGVLRDEDRSPYHIRSYYSVLAWDSEQVELFSGPATVYRGPATWPAAENVREFYNNWLAASAGMLDARDPCPAAPAYSTVWGGDPCGPVAIALQSLSFGFTDPPEEVEELELGVGPAQRSAVRDPQTGLYDSWPHVTAVASLRVNDETERDGNFHWDLRGTALSGRSLRPQSENYHFHFATAPNQRTERADGGRWLFPSEPPRRYRH